MSLTLIKKFKNNNIKVIIINKDEINRIKNYYENLISEKENNFK
jgi:hypothetical protein